MKRCAIYYLPGHEPVVVADDPYVGGDLLAQAERVVLLNADGSVSLVKDRLLRPKTLLSAIPSRARKAGE